MQILYNDETGKIEALAEDGYIDYHTHMNAPVWFTPEDMERYKVVDGELVGIVPIFITPRQAEIALLQAGLLDDVVSAIASIPDETTRRIAQIEWAKAQEVRRDWPLLNQLATQIGLTPDQIDDLFRQAALI